MGVWKYVIGSGARKRLCFIRLTIGYVVAVSFAGAYAEQRYGLQLRRSWLGLFILLPAFPGILMFLGDSIEGRRDAVHRLFMRHRRIIGL